MPVKKKLSRADKKQIEAAISRANRTDQKGISAQDSIPYERMWPDGICRVTDCYYTKTIQFQDINYQLSQNEDKTAIFEGGAISSTTLTAPSGSSCPSSTWPRPRKPLPGPSQFRPRGTILTISAASTLKCCKTNWQRGTTV